MAAADYNQDVGGLSTGITASQLQQSYQRADAQRAQNETWVVGGFVAVILIAIVAAHYAAEHRRKIARAADAALISGLATGVRAVRAASSAKDALIERVRAKADEKPPSSD